MQNIMLLGIGTIILKYVVTGGAGFVGNHYSKIISFKEGHDVTSY